MPESRRLFFALWPDPAGADALDGLARAAHRSHGGRPMGRNDLHLTLAFLGDVTSDRLPAAEAAAAGVTAAGFDFTLDCLGCWRHNRILWAGCRETPPALADLAGKLAARLGEADFTLEKRAFAPHVTLLRKADCSRGLPTLAEPVGWPVREFVLAESSPTPGGARYTVIRRWPLGTSIG